MPYVTEDGKVRHQVIITMYDELHATLKQLADTNKASYGSILREGLVLVKDKQDGKLFVKRGGKFVPLQ